MLKHNTHCSSSVLKLFSSDLVAPDMYDLCHRVKGMLATGERLLLVRSTEGQSRDICQFAYCLLYSGCLIVLFLLYYYSLLPKYAFGLNNCISFMISNYFFFVLQMSYSESGLFLLPCYKPVSWAAVPPPWHLWMFITRDTKLWESGECSVHTLLQLLLYCI